MQISKEDITDFLSAYKVTHVFAGAPMTHQVTNVKDYTLSNLETLTWMNDTYDSPELILKATFGLLLVSETGKNSLENLGALAFPILVVNQPKVIFGSIVNHFHPFDAKGYIHPTAVVHPEASIAENVRIGAYTVIEKCVIGAHTEIDSHCHIFEGVKIGEHVVIKSFTVIGAAPYMFFKDIKQNSGYFPTFGHVTIGDHVYIGSNTCIDKGSNRDTMIKSGVKIDNLVQIAHDVIIGENSLVISNTIIAGFVEIGSNVKLSPSVTVLQRLKIGNNVQVGTSAVVTVDIPDNKIFVGNPAMDIKKYAIFEKERLKLVKS